MIKFLSELNLVVVVIIASGFTWLVTALGAACIFLFRNVKKSVLNSMMGLAAGVMIAASFWSLLLPALELSKELGHIQWLWPAVGFLCGGLFVIIVGLIFDKYDFFSKPNLTKNNPVIDSASKKRSLLLIMSITMHNIPEGLCIGVAIGAVAAGVSRSDLTAALLMAFGIGIQNFPEGISVALPLHREGLSLKKSFFFGQLSGLVEPIAAILGFFLSKLMTNILPFALSFSAGAMIAVVASELLPTAAEENKRLTTVGCILGFLIMMILDIALS